MQLKDFEFISKRETGISGKQIVLDFGQYHLSVIDDGYGRDQGLFEIAIFNAKDGVGSDFVRLPGISNPDDDVLGNLSEADVSAIIKKMYSITGTKPTQI